MVTNHFYSQNQHFTFDGFVDWNWLDENCNEQEHNDEWNAFRNICPVVAALKETDALRESHSRDQIKDKIRNCDGSLYVHHILKPHVMELDPKGAMRQNWLPLYISTVCVTCEKQNVHDGFIVVRKIRFVSMFTS